ncbi:alpha/beta hydrolase fold domain-containing protein, partial [Paenibacillus albidus]|uniref:alpha-L-rhamnosidase-related protein n=1 Tax=Paenibacillus albidus TaxID=2041023 RepID=UPI001BE6B3DC
MNVQTISLSNENVTLTAYLLDSSSEMPNVNLRPAVLIFPGGGYQICSGREAEPIAMAYLAEGYHAFILRYSTKQRSEFPRPLHDAEEALERIRNASSEWRVDRDKIAVCGFSAGGHLAAALGTMGRVRPSALILGYPCILESMSRIFPFSVPGVDQHVDAATPPSFIFHTVADALVPVENALAFANALDRAKVPFEMHIFQNGTHGLSLSKPLTSGGLMKLVDQNAAKWFDLSVSWLKNVFGDFDISNTSNLNDQISEYSVGVQLGVLWKNPECVNVILHALPSLQGMELHEEAQAAPLQLIIEFGDLPISPKEVEELNKKLKAIPSGSRNLEENKRAKAAFFESIAGKEDLSMTDYMILKMYSDETEDSGLADGSAGWSDAAVINPYTMYLCYGDRQIIENQYESAAKHVKYMFDRAKNANPNREQAPEYHTWTYGELDADYIWDTEFHWGEWLEADVGTAGEMERMMEKFTNADPDVPTAFLCYSTRLVGEMAHILGRADEAKIYLEKSEKVKRMFN